MEFSSTSSDDDEDLVAALQRNVRRERREQGGIVRTASSARSQARRFTLPDGHAIEVRRGCIYIPARETYVHLLQAQQCPQRWFGDGRVPLRRRAALPADHVLLTQISDAADGPPHPVGHVTLADATDIGFFVFHEVRDPSCGDSTAVPSATCLVSWADPYVDTRLQRILDLRAWRRALAHSSALTQRRHNAWSAAEVAALRAQEVCCFDSLLGLLWKYDGAQSVLYTLRYLEHTAALEETALATLPVPPQQCLSLLYAAAPAADGFIGSGGVAAAAAVASAAHGVSFRLLLLGVSHMAVVSLTALLHPSRDPALAHVVLTRVQTTALRLTNVTCWCVAPSVPSLAPAESPLTLWVGAGRSIFRVGHRDNGEPLQPRQLTSFATTDVTALAVLGAADPWRSSGVALVAAGMRNGTLQLVHDDGRRRHTARFDTTVRHSGSDVTAVYEVPEMTHGLLSVARSGEAKVWDLRMLANHRDPVHTIFASRSGSGWVAQSGTCSSALAGSVLAVASAASGLTCVHLPQCATVFHSAQHTSAATRLVMGTVDDVSYEVYTFSPYFTQRFELAR